MASYSTVHNGGRTQIGMTPLGGDGGFPFLNLMKGANRPDWISYASPWAVTPDYLNSNGYPTSLINGGMYWTFYVPSQTSRPGNYVIKWDGNGTIFCGMTNTPVSGSKTTSSGSGRYEFSTSSVTFIVGISSLGSPIISNLRVCHKDDESLLDAGEIFQPKFKEKLTEGGFGVLRFMDWVPSNDTNQRYWADRKPTTYIYYAGCEYRSAIFTGLTAGSGVDYTAALPGFVLVDKAMVTVQFDRSNSAACTLNVEGTGAKNILSEYASALSGGGNSYPLGVSDVSGVRYRSVATLMYDADLGAWVKHGGDYAISSMGINNGVPPELMIQLCAEIGAHPHFVMPAYALDPMTDYVSSLAQMCKDFCASNNITWMVPRFEGPNELWNTHAGFFHTNYAIEKANAHWVSSNFNQWYGKVMSTIGQAVSAVYSGDTTKYQVLCGVQTGLGNNSSQDPRLTSASYVAQAAAAQSGYTKSAAKNWVTTVCCAQYYNSKDTGQAAEVTAAADYAAASGAAAKQAIADTYSATCATGGTFTLDANAVLYAAVKTWAKSHGINRMCGYEGGYSPDYTAAAGDSDLDRLRAASKNSPCHKGFTYTNLRNFIGQTDSTFTAEFPSNFLMAYNNGGYDYSRLAWPIWEFDLYGDEPPQWTAIKLFNQRKVRLTLAVS